VTVEMPYRVRLFDRFDQQISYQDLETPAEAAAWASEAWDALLSERVGPPAEGEPAGVRHELTFVDSDEQERPVTEEENREFSEALARG
jgi:hypothetical protein